MKSRSLCEVGSVSQGGAESRDLLAGSHAANNSCLCSELRSGFMKAIKVRFGRGFRVVLGNKRSQAATMVIPVGGKEGGPDNNHRGLDQWLFVVSGKGVAKVGNRKVSLGNSSLVLIESGENHEIRNTGATDLVTLNFYLPPGYTKVGDELPPAKAKF